MSGYCSTYYKYTARKNALCNSQDTFSLSFVYIMRLRIRHAEGITTLSDVKQDQTVSMLKDAIKKAIALDDARDIQSKQH